MNRIFLSLLAASRTRSRPLDTLFRPCVRDVVVCRVFPLARPLSSTASATDFPVLFRGFAGTTGLSDFPEPCIIGLRPPGLSDAARRATLAGDPGISRFSRMEFPCMLRFFDSAEPAMDLLLAPIPMLPSA